MWNRTHNLREVDGYSIEIQWMDVGPKASQVLYKATTWTNFADEPAEEPVESSRYGSSLTDAIASLLNDVKPMEYFLQPVKP